MSLALDPLIEENHPSVNQSHKMALMHTWPAKCSVTPRPFAPRTPKDTVSSRNMRTLYLYFNSIYMTVASQEAVTGTEALNNCTYWPAVVAGRCRHSSCTSLQRPWNSESPLPFWDSRTRNGQESLASMLWALRLTACMPLSNAQSLNRPWCYWVGVAVTKLTIHASSVRAQTSCILMSQKGLME